MDVVLFAPANHKPPARSIWNVADFNSVDDTLRGGSSKSSMRIEDKSAGIDFTGYLDTTTLGGAGFASQAYSKDDKGFPGASIDAEKFAGIRLVVSVPTLSQADVVDVPQEGGGKGPVTSFTLNLKTEMPANRPDGRKESTIVYECSFNAPKSAAEGEMNVDAEWAQFKPTYRGRPANDADPLDPAKVKEWSIMARSNFAEQSGHFSLRLVSLSAISADQVRPRDITNQSYISSPESSGSGEYYGFALFIVATVVMVLWFTWALVPDRILKQIGIDWYPNREWAFLIPAWSMFAVLFTYAAFISLNMHNNPPLDDLSNVIDSRANIAKIGLASDLNRSEHPLKGLSMADTGRRGAPLADDIYDIPPGIVSRERHGLYA